MITTNASDMRKCAVIGCGNVGATCAYTLTQSGMFTHMLLIDINKKKAEGEAADLRHGLPFLTPMEIRSGEYPELAGYGLIIIAAGVNQKPGQSRRDLLRQNVKIFRSVVGEIKRYNAEAILLVVTNPVDVLTYAALKYSGFPAGRVIGSGTVLDTARLKQMLGERLEVDSRNVHIFIIGEHGDSELAVWSSANISGIDLNRFFMCDGQYGECLQDIEDSLYEEVKNSAYRIIEAKGATYYAIAESVKRIVEAIIRDEDTILPVSTLVTGQYGIDGMCMSLPCVVGCRGIHRVLEIPLNESESYKLHESAKALRAVIDDADSDVFV